MEKIYTAIGDFYNEEGAQLIDVPADEQEIYAAVEKIMDECPAGTVLTNEQIQILRAYLPAIGCDEATRDDNYSLQGKGTVTKKAEGCGVEQIPGLSSTGQAKGILLFACPVGRKPGICSTGPRPQTRAGRSAPFASPRSTADRLGSLPNLSVRGD